MSNVTWTDVGLIILAILLPPLAVFIKAEEFNKGQRLAHCKIPIANVQVRMGILMACVFGLLDLELWLLGSQAPHVTVTIISSLKCPLNQCQALNESR